MTTNQQLLADNCNQLEEFILDLAGIILPRFGGFDRAWETTNAVYDQHCNAKAARVA